MPGPDGAGGINARGAPSGAGVPSGLPTPDISEGGVQVLRVVSLDGPRAGLPGAAKRFCVEPSVRRESHEKN